MHILGCVDLLNLSRRSLVVTCAYDYVHEQMSVLVSARCVCIIFSFYLPIFAVITLHCAHHPIPCHSMSILSQGGEALSTELPPYFLFIKFPSLFSSPPSHGVPISQGCKVLFMVLPPYFCFIKFSSLFS